MIRVFFNASEIDYGYSLTYIKYINNNTMYTYNNPQIHFSVVNGNKYNKLRWYLP